MGYKERIEEKRQEFQKELEGIPSENIIYLDETGIYSNEALTHGWAPKGSRLFGFKSGTHKEQFNVVAGLQQGKLIAPLVVEGTLNADVFTIYVEAVLKPFLRPGSVVILDNASFHRASQIEDIVSGAGGRVLYLPTYSPDLNPIERSWFSLKQKIRHAIRDGSGALDTIMNDIFGCVN